MGRYYERRQTLPVKVAVNLIRPEVLNGMDKKSISEMHSLDIRVVDQAMDVLLKDAEIRNIRSEREVERNFALKQMNEEKENVRIKREQILIDEKRNSKRITDDLKLNIVEDFETGNYSQKDLSSKYGVSNSTICRIIRQLLSEDEIKNIRELHTQKHGKMIQKMEDIDEIISADDENDYSEVVDEYSLTEYNEDSDEVSSLYPDTNIDGLVAVDVNNIYKTVGLVNNRHNMYVNTYIFDSIPDDKLFDFRWLEETVENFIKENIEFNSYGVPKQGLIVKCTGLQSAIMALTKICYNMQVNLIVSHYQILRDSKFTYRKQPIFTDFPMDNDVPYLLTHLGGSVSKLYTYNSSPRDYSNIENFYEIHVMNKPEFCRMKNVNKKPINTYSILCKSFEDMLKCQLILSKVFSIDRSLFRYLKTNYYESDSNSSIGYKSTILQTSYF